MLTALRSKASSLVLKILFALLIASFAIWGIGDIFRSGFRSGAPVTVGSIAFTPAELQSDYRRQFAQLQANYGGAVDADTARALGLPNRVVSEAVVRGLLAEYSGRIGMRVTDDRVRRAIQDDPSFRNDLGQFDRARFQAWLDRNGMSEGELVRRLRNEIMRNQLMSSLVAGVQPPQTLVSAVHQYQGEERVAQVLKIAAASMPDVPTPTDAALEAYYQEHVDAYQAPEYRAVTVITLSPEDLAKEIRISDEDVAAAFESRKQEFDQPEKRHLDQIVFPDEAAAKAAAEKLANGADFVEVAREATGGAPIDLGTVSKEALAGTFAELADVAFATPEGQVTAPTRTVLGWHIVRVLAVEPAKPATLAEHREALANELALEQAHDSIISIANQLEDELAGGATLEEAADKLKLPVTEIAAVDATGKAPDGTTVELAKRESGLAGVAFETPEGEQSPLTDSATGGYYILRVDGVTPAAAKPLAEVRNQVAIDWLAAERAKWAQEKAAAVVDRLKNGEDIAAVATELGATVKTSMPVTRDEEDAAAGLDIAAVDTLFTLKQGEVAAVPAGDDQLVLRLAEIKKPTDGGDPQATAAVREDLRGEIANDVVSQFMAALQQDIPVSIDQDAVDQLF